MIKNPGDCFRDVFEAARDFNLYIEFAWNFEFTIRKLVIIIRKMFKEIHMVYYKFWDYGFPEELRLNKGKIRKIFLLTESLFFKV